MEDTAEYVKKEDKEGFVKDLEKAAREAGDVDSLEYMCNKFREIVLITYTDGYTKAVDVTICSLKAIAMEIFRNL